MTGNFSLGEEHNDFRAAVADFAARDLAPHVERWNAATRHRWKRSSS
jgi:hypothetical protein